jgi:hypothetical protein
MLTPCRLASPGFSDRLQVGGNRGGGAIGRQEDDESARFYSEICTELRNQSWPK